MKRILAPWAKPINLCRPHLIGNCLHTFSELLKAGRTQRENRIKHGGGRSPPAWRACEQSPVGIPQGQGAHPALISQGSVPPLPLTSAGLAARKALPEDALSCLTHSSPLQHWQRLWSLRSPPE